MKEQTIVSKIREILPRYVSERIKALCEERGWRPADLMRASGVSSALISLIMKGNRSLHITTLIAVAIGLDVEVKDLLPSRADVLNELGLVRETETITRVVLKEKSDAAD